MSVDYRIKTEIRRAIETGELLRLDYMNAKGENTFYFIGINSLKFAEDETKIKGFAFNYQFKKTMQIEIRIDRIKSAKCIEGTKQFFKNNLKSLIKVPEINNYFRNELSEKSILDYYSDCVEGSSDLEYASTYGYDTTEYRRLKENRYHDLSKEEVNDILMMLNIDEDKHRNKYKLAFNYLCVSNLENEIIPLIYIPVYLDVFQEKIILDDEELIFHTKNIADLLYIKTNDVGEYFDDIDRLSKDLEDVLRGNQLRNEEPLLFKLKLDISFSTRSEYQMIKGGIYKQNELSPVIKGFFGKYQKPLLASNRNIYFINNKVNSKQLQAVHSAMTNELTYVQGPPGTGKTETIRNIIISSFLNNDTTLITSYTNAAVDNIYKKLWKLQYNSLSIPLPFIRLSSQENTIMGLKYAKRAYEHYLEIIDSIDIKKLKTEFKEEIEQEIRKLSNISAVFEDNEKIEDILSRINTYDEIINVFSKDHNFKKKLKIINKHRSVQKGLLTKISKRDIDNTLESNKIDFKVVKKGLLIKSIEYLQKLDTDEFKSLRNILFIEDEKEKCRTFYTILKDQFGLKKVLSVFPMIFSTNISTRRIGNSIPEFDLLIMDEAGQCENAFSILAMARAKRAAFIGDPNQLLPVVTVSERLNNSLKDFHNIPDIYDYKQTSILNTMNQVDFVNDIILLNKHYRCKSSIVDFANKKYYNGKLIIQNMSVSEDDCKFINTNSTFHRHRKNTSAEEVSIIIEELMKLPPDQSIGIITPYRNQQSLLKSEIKKYFPDKKNIKVGTVHKFQGQEEDIIMLSLAIGRDSYEGSYNWLKNNKQLINVATTRPKERLIVVGDEKAIAKLSGNEPSDILDLISYTSKFNKDSYTDFKHSKVYSDITRKTMYSAFEKPFVETLNKILNINTKNLKYSGQTDIKQVLKIDKTHLYYKKISEQSFDFVLLDNKHEILLAIEVCGPEHYYDPEVIKRDSWKKHICKEQGIDLLFVNNRDVKRYRFIRDIIEQIIPEALQK
ncbi:MAG: AAA family ATPase [Tenericutes bacterium]|nr:AAA family ATPase [Mycoplasmatota bacterium]